jgi:hypothetical protein
MAETAQENDRDRERRARYGLFGLLKPQFGIAD